MSRPAVYDVAILGAGTAGLAALRQVRRHTDHFVLVNHGAYGTTCARVGCMPSKVLIEAAKAVHHGRGLGFYGVGGSEALTVDLPSVLRHVRRLRDSYVKGVLRTTDELGDRNIPGRGRLVEPDVIEVDGRRLRARRIIIATGSRPVVPEEWRGFRDTVLTSDTVFEQPDLPTDIAVIGAGGVGAELAQALARLGSRITVFDAGRQVAGLSDPAVNDQAVRLLRAEFPLHLGAPALLEADGARVRVRAGETSVTVDKVLAALGRRPNLDELGLERLGVERDTRGVPIYNRETMQIGDWPVFIAGDVNGDVPLLHEAADEGYIAAYNAVRDQPRCFQRRVPLVIVFTDPNIAVVGKAQGDLHATPHIVGTVDFTRQGRLRMTAEDRGCLRVYAESDTGKLLGSELCAPRGEHMAHLLALAMQHQLTVYDLLRMPFYHPVAEEGLRRALRELAAQIPGEDQPDLARCERPEADALH